MQLSNKDRNIDQIQGQVSVATAYLTHHPRSHKNVVEGESLKKLFQKIREKRH